MIIPDYLENYIIPLDKFDTNLICNDVERLGIDEVIAKYITYMDCSKIYPNNIRPVQTISYTYYSTISKLLWIIENLIVEEKYKQEVLNKIIAQHELNIEFEKENAPILYTKKPFKREKVIKEPKEKKPRISAAERKLVTKLAKINSLSFTLKPIKTE